MSFETCNFFERYKLQIEALSKEKILKLLKQYNSEIIVFLVWEAENKQSERDVFIAWLNNCTTNDVKSFSFTRYLSTQKIIESEKILFSL